MSKKFILVLCFLFLILTITFTAYGQESKPLIAGADISYPPFEYKEGNTAVGFDIDLWQEIGKRIGRIAIHENYSWDGLIPALLAEKFDVIMSCMGITEGRAKNIAFSVPYFKESFGICVRKETTDIKKLEDLNGKIVGLQTGVMTEKWVREHEQELGIKQIVAYEVVPDIILDLQSGRIDAALSMKPYLAYITKEIDDIYLLVDISFGDNIFDGIGLRKEDVELKEKIDKAIKEIVDDGTYLKLFVKWFGVEPSKEDMRGIGVELSE